MAKNKKPTKKSEPKIHKKVIKKILQFDLNEHQMAEAGKHLATLHMRQNHMMIDQDGILRGLRAARKLMKEEIANQVLLVTRGHEEKEVECLEISDFEKKTITIMVDGKEHSSRDMNEHETQIPLRIDEPEEIDFDADDSVTIEASPEDEAKTPKEQVRDVIQMETSRKQKKDLVTSPDKKGH